jgi:hypothetical protein
VRPLYAEIWQTRGGTISGGDELDGLLRRCRIGGAVLARRVGLHGIQ